MVVIVLAFALIGMLYGIASGSGPLSVTLLGLAYCVLGVIIGVPTAAFVNLTRRLWH